jgi:fumarate hydratase subunit alpha/L(+)-tartrate dehydratase alpha subunit
MGHATLMLLSAELVEETVALLYIRALKHLPPPVKQGIARLRASETSARGRAVLDVLEDNIAVAEADDVLLCQDTGIPIVTLTIGRGVGFDGAAVTEAVRRGVAKATREHPLRSSVVHPITRHNNHDSTGLRIPVVQFEFTDIPDIARIELVPKGSGSENGSWLRMCLPSEGLDAIKRFVIERVIEAGGKVCPPTIVGVGVGGTSDLCLHLAKLAATRPLGTICDDPSGAALEAELTRAVNLLGIGPQGLGGDSTAFAVQVEVAATHITLNPVAVNIQCHSARRASAEISPVGVTYGY